jgi:hypothetical protein
MALGGDRQGAEGGGGENGFIKRKSQPVSLPPVAYRLLTEGVWSWIGGSPVMAVDREERVVLGNSGCRPLSGC